MHLIVVVWWSVLCNWWHSQELRDHKSPKADVEELEKVSAADQPHRKQVEYNVRFLLHFYLLNTVFKSVLFFSAATLLKAELVVYVSAL